MKQRTLKVTVASLAALGCMASAALAMEHDFNGLLRIKGDFTNFDQAGKNDAAIKLNPNSMLSRDSLGKSFFYTEQRLRLKYTGKLTNDVKLVTQFEIDSRWGDNSQTINRNQGGGIEADSINLETKNVYMEFKVPYLPTTVKAGIQSFDDAYKGVFLGADIAGVMTTTKIDKAVINAGWLRAYDNKNFDGSTALTTATGVGTTSGNTITPGPGSAANGNNVPGRYSMDLGILDVKYDVSKALKVGGSYYMTYDNLSTGLGYNILSTLGVNAAYNFGLGVVDGFFLYQVGDNPTNNFGRPGSKVTAFAANVGAKIKAGPGTARANILYASGDDGKGSVHAFQGVNQLGEGNTTSTFPAAQMTILITNTKYAANTDRGLINTISNYDQGVIGAFFGYDLDIDKTFIKANLGLAAAARENQTFKPRNQNTGGFNSNYIGTEINAEVGYKISENLTASLVSGYVFLGNYYKDTALPTTGGVKTPDNPWKNMVVLNLAF